MHFMFPFRRQLKMLLCIFFYRPTILGILLQTFQYRCSHVAMLSDVKGDENLSISDAECCTHKALLTQWVRCKRIIDDLSAASPSSKPLQGSINYIEDVPLYFVNRQFIHDSAT